MIQEDEDLESAFDKYSLLIDTDSCSIECKPVCDKLLGGVPEEWTEEQIDIVTDYLDNKLTNELNEHCTKIAREFFLTEESYIEFKREKLAQVGLFLARKNYSVLVLNDEGVTRTHWVHKGNYLRKSVTPPRLKKYLKEAVEVGGIKNWSNSKFTKFCTELFNEVKTWPLEDFCKSLGYSTEKHFLKPFDITGVTSSNAIAVNLYNDMLHFCKIEHKYDKIRVGDKFRMVYVIPKYNAPCKMQYIGFNGTFPSEFLEYMDIDYKTCFDKYFIKPLERYMNTFHWSAPEVTKPSLFDISDL